MIALTLYGRADCHLCEAMAEQLRPLIHGRAELTTVDVSGDDALERRYGARIPVLVAGEQELSYFHLNVARVEAYLAQAT